MSSGMDVKSGNVLVFVSPFFCLGHDFPFVKYILYYIHKSDRDMFDMNGVSGIMHICMWR